MSLKIPEFMDECIYFTNRGDILAWVYRKLCPKCKKAKMGKPVNKGQIKIRATEYECPACKYTEQKEEHEASLKMEAKYTCPECGKEGESPWEYKRKNYKGVPSYLVECQHCKAKIALTKKLKKLKGKKAKAGAEEDVDDEEI